jgi:hypothetical protein
MALLLMVSDKNKHKNLERSFYISLGIGMYQMVRILLLPHPAKLNPPVFMFKCEADNSAELYLCFS